jgi:putative ABC transport system permease protein
MSEDRLLRMSERWFRRLQRLYPPDFRDEMEDAIVETYMDRVRDTLRDRGRVGVAGLWLRALVDSLRNSMAERVRPAVMWRRAGTWGRDIELVGRRLMRSPVFFASTVGTLTIGLGMFAVAYGVVQTVLLDPMPYKNSGDLYYVWRDYTATGVSDLKRGALAGTDVAELQKPNAVIQDAAGLQPFLGGVFALREGAAPMEIAVTSVSPNLLEVLGVSPAIGRGFARDEIGPAGAQVILLTHRLWTRLGADPAIVGSTVRLQSRPRTVVGVLPQDFSFVRSDAAAPPQRVEAFIPFDTPLDQTKPGTLAYTGILRAREDASPHAVAEAIAAAGRVIDARDFNGKGMKLYPTGLKDDVVSRIRPALVVLGAAAVVLALMLMVNLASALLAREARRAHELAISRALGANSAAIVRAALLEGGMLGIVGGTLGTLAAQWGTHALVALSPLDLPRREAIGVDWRVAAVTIAIGGVLGVLAASSPAVWAVRTSLSSLLASSAVRGGGGHGRLRRAMIVAQVALTLVLLSSGALVIRSFDRLLRADPGFRPEGLFTVRIRTPPEFFPQMSDALAFQERVQGVLGALPGVSGASAASTLPLTATAYQMEMTIPGAPGNTGDAERDKFRPDVVGVRENYVQVMGMRMVAGRTFSEPPRRGVVEAIVDETVVQRFFPTDNPLGATIRLSNASATIVGVVQQARLYDVHHDGRPQVLFRVSEDFGFRPLFFVMRTTRDPDSLLPEVQAAVHRLDPRVPVGDPRSMDAIVGQSLSPQAIGASLLGAFAIGALLLATLGLFGVVSESVTRRHHELAVRLALGAPRPSLLRMVLKEGMALVTIGLSIGTPGIYLASGAIQGLLLGVSPLDPMALLGAASGLLLTTLVACYMPARRALRIDPASLFRQ